MTEATLELIRELQEQGPTEEEIEKAKRRYLWDLQTVRDDPEDTVHFIGTSALFRLPEEVATIANQIAAVSSDDVQRAAQKYLDPRLAYLTCVGILDDDLLSTVEGFVRG